MKAAQCSADFWRGRQREREWRDRQVRIRANEEPGYRVRGVLVWKGVGALTNEVQERRRIALFSRLHKRLL